MLAPVPKKRKDGGSSFSSLSDYLTKEIDKETGEVLSRGEVMLSDNLLSAETAAAEMKAVAAENTRCKDPVLHLVLSWKVGEQPTSEQWQEAVKHAMGSLKDREGVSMADHQYLAVAHRDTENFHVHIQANRVHPETYRANSPEWLHKTLDKSCREIEAKQGWGHSNGLYRWDEDKGKAIAMTREEREEVREQSRDFGLERGTAGTGKAAKMEEYSNAESLETYAKGAPAKALNEIMKHDNVNWQEVHSALKKHGLELHKGEKGGYTVSGDGDGERIHVKASKVFRGQFAGKEQRAATDEKLGTWESPKEFLKHVTKTEKEYSQHREPKRDPKEREERRDERAQLKGELKERYIAYKEKSYTERRAKAADNRETAKLRADLQSSKRDEWAKLRTVDRLQKVQNLEDARQTLTQAERKAHLSVSIAESIKASDLVKEKATQLKAVQDTQRQGNKPEDYKTWVTAQAKEGDRAAIAQIRGWQYQEGRDVRAIERKNEEIDRRESVRPNDNDRHEPLDPRIFADAKKSAALRMTWEVDTKTGDVAYHIDGKKAFTDHGERVSFGNGKDDEAIETGLRMAAQKYGGEVKLNGTAEFQMRAVQVAAERGVTIKFANKELSIYHEACKHQVQVQREREVGRRRGLNEPVQDRSQDSEQDHGRSR
jgi:hypothetical protein